MERQAGLNTRRERATHARQHTHTTCMLTPPQQRPHVAHSLLSGAQAEQARQSQPPPVLTRRAPPLARPGAERPERQPPFPPLPWEAPPVLALAGARGLRHVAVAPARGSFDRGRLTPAARPCWRLCVWGGRGLAAAPSTARQRAKRLRRMWCGTSPCCASIHAGTRQAKNSSRGQLCVAPSRPAPPSASCLGLHPVPCNGRTHEQQRVGIQSAGRDRGRGRSSTHKRITPCPRPPLHQRSPARTTRKASTTGQVA